MVKYITMQKNLNDPIYICEEVFDGNSEPTQTEIEEQACRLGINPVKELHLLNIARHCLLEPLPSDWFPCYIEKENKYFYYNKESKTSQWEHPLDEYYRQIVDRTRSEDSSTGQDVSLNIILDEDNLLDSEMYHTKNNNNYEKKTTAEKRTVRFKNPIEESLDIENSEENVKFLGPIKLNTPYTSTLSNLQNLPQFSTNNTFDSRSTKSRSVFSKYNILPNKEELPKKLDVGENVKKINDDPIIMSGVNLFSTGKENMRKIDITLTESSDQSESTSSEIRTENLNSDYEKNDLKEKDNIITTIQMNKHQERKDILNGDRSIGSDNFNKFQSTGTTATQLQYNNNMKKDDLISDSGNSTAKDSKIIQSSMATNSFSAAKNEVFEIAQRFPLKQFTNTNETTLLKTKPSMESNKCIFDISIKSNSDKSNFELESSTNDKKQTSQFDADHIKIIIENYWDLMKNKLEETIKTKENTFREEFIKKIDDLIREQNNNFEKHIEARHNELFIKNELELKNMLENVQEKMGKSLIEECDLKYIQNVSNAEQTCKDNLKKFQKDLDDYGDMFKNQIQLELDVIANELKKEFCENSEVTTTDSWNQILKSYKNVELEKVKNNFEQTTENIKRDTDDEIYRFNLEFKEKLKVISEDKLNDVNKQLDIALRDEIDLIKKRVNKNYPRDINIKISKHKPQSKLCIEQESHSAEYQTFDTHNVNYSDIRKKIQHCSNELNDVLRLVNEVTISTSDEYATGSNKCTVSCQTENIIMWSHPKTSLNEYPYLAESPNMSIFNNLSGVDTNTAGYADYWNRAKTSEDIWRRFNHTTTAYSKMLSPLDILNKEELKVNAAEQNICHLIDTFNNLKHTSVYHNPYISNIYQNKFTNINQPLTTQEQIAYNRTKHLREWLYKTDLNRN